jgi:hypothetical protein
MAAKAARRVTQGGTANVNSHVQHRNAGITESPTTSVSTRTMVTTAQVIRIQRIAASRYHRFTADVGRQRYPIGLKPAYHVSSTHA